MKFLYADESGAKDHSRFFTMAGVMVDAVKLRKRTEDIDKLWLSLANQHPDSPSEIKTGRMINGKGGWSKVAPDIRKKFISDIIHLATENGGKIFCIALDFEKFQTLSKDDYELPYDKQKWTYCALYLASLVQKKMQIVKGKKGLTVFVMDDNKAEIPTLTNGLYESPPWFDGLYAVQKKKRGKNVWVERKKADRFDHIVNTTFSINSEHSTFVQAADVVSYVYRRHLEIVVDGEAYDGERTLFDGWFNKLEGARQKQGRTQDCAAKRFYENLTPDGWTL